MTSHGVVIAGAGPTGLMLAGELALAGIDVAIVERRPTQALAGSRAGGLSARTLEVLDQRGIVDRFLVEGQKAQVTGFAVTRLDISDFPTRHNYGLALWQGHIERLLADWVHELGVVMYRGRDVTGFVQDARGVEVLLSEGEPLRAQYLVGCDGGRSVVRKAAGIEFAGWDATTSSLLAEVDFAEPPPMGMHHTARGMHGFGRVEYDIRDGQVVFRDEGQYRVILTDPQVNPNADPSLHDLRDALVAVCGTDYGVHTPTWITRFSDATRQAAQYRNGRVLLAGDAAHIHSPVGGQGLNTGVQDAVNLGWKLALVVQGVAPDSLLDAYHAERHPVAARVLQNTMAQVVLHRQDARSKAVRDVVLDLLTLDAARRQIAGMMSGLDIRYALGDGHPLLGRRMPDLDLRTHAGVVRVYSLLHAARPVLLNLGPAGTRHAGVWAERVTVIDATYDGAWELPVIGVADAPQAVLIRPDGHVAWVASDDARALDTVLDVLFGLAAPGAHRDG